MNRKTVVINTSLALVLLAAAVGAVMQIDNPSAPKPVEQTAVVTQGDVSTTVTTTGNLDSPHTVGLPFSGQPGVVSAIYTKIGDDVKGGDKLAAVDDRAAKAQYLHAQAAVAQAKGQLLTATEGETAQEHQLDQANIAASVQDLANAQQAVQHARQQLAVDTTEQSNLVRAAERNVTRTANATATRARQIATATQTNPAGTNTTTSDTRSRQRDRSIQLQTSTAAVAQAEAQRSVTLLQDAQAVKRAKNEATLAARNLSVARAQAAVNAQGGKPGERATAEGQVQDALASVKDAKDALADTVLRAPFAGRVVDIAGNVGETPIGAVRGSAAASASPNGPGAVENRKPATQTGFVILADLTHKYVTAQVDEADVGKILPGQPANVTFPATGAKVAGTVEKVYEQEIVINNVVEYNVDIVLNDAAATLKLGQSATVQIVTSDKKNVMSVPNAALIRAGDQSLLQVRRGTQLMKIPVTIGLVGDSSTEVSSPLLKAGDVVVLPSAGGGGAGGGGKKGGSKGLGLK
jgi:multidrug efflux pump subunit AcrA (membrane-fusion protein)